MPSTKTVERVPGGWIANYTQYPWMLSAPALAFGGTLLALASSRARRAGFAFVLSYFGVAGVVLTAGFEEEGRLDTSPTPQEKSSLTLLFLFFSLVY